MMRMERFNDTVNYSNRAFDFGFRADHIPDVPVYAVREGEEVRMAALSGLQQMFSLMRNRSSCMKWSDPLRMQCTRLQTR